MAYGYDRYGWRPYVPVAQRRVNAAKAVQKMAKGGAVISPVVLQSKKIATTFWGKAWCGNLEAYSDYSNRLPRGRTYVRNGSVVDLQIGKGRVTSMVSGSELYKIEIKITPLSKNLWEKVQYDCAGKIDSLIELLQGRLSTGVMEIVTRRDHGLFPAPKEISMKCSCPDSAYMCKHLAATLYGVGARLDEEPDLLFLLRGVDPSELISKASAAEAVRQTTPASSATAIGDADLADVFGIEIESVPAKPAMPKAPPLSPPVPAKRPRAKKTALSVSAEPEATNVPLIPAKRARAKKAATPTSAPKLRQLISPGHRPGKKIPPKLNRP